MSREPANDKIKVAILGSGNIGSDLMYKMLKKPGRMELAMFAGIDPASEGLARAKSLGIESSHNGIDAIMENDGIRIVFDATSARAHLKHARILKESGRVAIDLTPAAVGPYIVPPVNLNEHINEPNINMITCGGQATIPLVYAVSRVTPALYAEMVSTVASLSAGPGTRQNIDEFTFTTSRAIEVVGGAKNGKAIIVLNPADPAIMMRNTLYVVPENDDFDEDAVTQSVEEMVRCVSSYVPGYRLKNPPVFDLRPTKFGDRIVITMLLEVEGAGDYLPKYAGNLDIMTSSAFRVGELVAENLLTRQGILV